MDKNQSIGLVLLTGLVFVYFFYFGKPDQQETPVDNTSGQIENTTQNQVEESTQAVALSDSMQAVFNQDKYGFFSPLTQGAKKDVRIENENIAVVLSSAGGTIKNVLLKDYQTYTKEPLVLLDEQSSKMKLQVVSNGRTIDLNDEQLRYSVKESKKGDTTVIAFEAVLLDGQKLSKTYTLAPEGYSLGFDLTSTLPLNVMGSSLVFDWDNKLKLLEHEVGGSRGKTTLNYYTAKGDFDGFSERSNDSDSEKLEEPVHWVAMKQKFFTSAIVAEGGKFERAEVAISTPELDSSIVKNTKAQLNIAYSDVLGGKANYSFYFGPNNFSILKKVAPEFQENVNLGYPPVHLVNKYVIIPLFHFLERFISNYGIIIIILVLIIKLALSPLSYKSYISMAKMKVLKPELDELKEKYPDDLQKQQQEQMQLYRKVGASPLSGCVPMLLQMPILFAMFFFFPNSIELRQEEFLWASDLSTYDSILDLPFSIPFYGNHVSLFVILMTIASLLYTWSNNQVSTVQGPMQTVSYVMPVIFLFVLNSFPAALSFYYFVSTLVTFGQQMLIKKMVNEDKIKTILEENRKKNANKKKSKFAMRLDEAMKNSSEAQKKKKKK